MFNEEDIYNGINDDYYLFNENESKITHNSSIKYRGIKDFRYLFNENEDKITHNSNIRYLFNENEDKETLFKSIIEDIKRGLYYVEKMSNLSTLDIKNSKEKLIKFKHELFKNNNNNNRIKKDLNECKGIKYIRYLFHEDKNKKSDLYKAEKMKNLAVTKIKIKKDINEYKGLKDIRYLFNDNIYKGIIDIRYLFNEDYYVKKLDSKNIKSGFNKLSNNLVKAYTKTHLLYIVKNIL